MAKKIMVVDDEPDILFTIGQMLEMSGYEVIKAKDGKECIEILNKLDSNPDLVLLDIMMPDFSGWDVAAKIKENPKWSEISIVFLTAKGDTMSIGMGNLAAEDYIVKPFDVEDLRERVNAVINRKREKPVF
jgi:DNA-binding response OmpR family regulator